MRTAEYKEELIKRLLEGKTQAEIAEEFKSLGIKPNSLSTIEKTLQDLRTKHKAKTMFHLGAIITLKRYLK